MEKQKKIDPKNKTHKNLMNRFNVFLTNRSDKITPLSFQQHSPHNPEKCSKIVSKQSSPRMSLQQISEQLPSQAIPSKYLKHIHYLEAQIPKKDHIIKIQQAQIKKLTTALQKMKEQLIISYQQKPIGQCLTSDSTSKEQSSNKSAQINMQEDCHNQAEQPQDQNFSFTDKAVKSIENKEEIQIFFYDKQTQTNCINEEQQEQKLKTHITQLQKAVYFLKTKLSEYEKNSRQNEQQKIEFKNQIQSMNSELQLLKIDNIGLSNENQHLKYDNKGLYEELTSIKQEYQIYKNNSQQKDQNLSNLINKLQSQLSRSSSTQSEPSIKNQAYTEIMARISNLQKIVDKNYTENKQMEHQQKKQIILISQEFAHGIQELRKQIQQKNS